MFEKEQTNKTTTRQNVLSTEFLGESFGTRNRFVNVSRADGWKKKGLKLEEAR